MKTPNRESERDEHVCHLAGEGEHAAEHAERPVLADAPYHPLDDREPKRDEHEDAGQEDEQEIDRLSARPAGRRTAPASPRRS